MAEINLQEDLNAVNDNITKLVDELNKVNAARENLIQQVQNLNGVAMYLRGKLPPSEESKAPDMVPPSEDMIEEAVKDSLDRTTEYPDEHNK